MHIFLILKYLAHFLQASCKITCLQDLQISCKFLALAMYKNCAGILQKLQESFMKRDTLRTRILQW